MLLRVLGPAVEVVGLVGDTYRRLQRIYFTAEGQDLGMWVKRDKGGEGQRGRARTWACG